MGLCAPHPHLISFSLLRGKEKEIQDKEKETRRLHTVAKFNPRFANSSLRSSDNAHLVAVSSSDSNRNVKCVCWWLFHWIPVLRTRMTVVCHLRATLGDPAVILNSIQYLSMLVLFTCGAVRHEFAEFPCFARE